MHKDQWGPGPWQSEPDRLDWRDERTGLQCVIRRVPLGYLCGYVGVPVGHPFYGWSYHDKIKRHPDDLKESTLGDVGIFAAFLRALGEDDENGTIELAMALKVHHGVNWSGGGPDDDMESGLWWFGFDCGHAWDLSPGFDDQVFLKMLPTELMKELRRRQPKPVYRTIDYVKKECASLAFQLRQLETRAIKTEMPEALRR